MYFRNDENEREPTVASNVSEIQQSPQLTPEIIPKTQQSPGLLTTQSPIPPEIAQPAPPAEMTTKPDHEIAFPVRPQASSILSSPILTTDDESVRFLKEPAPHIQESPIQSSLPGFTAPQLSESDTFLPLQATLTTEEAINPNNGDSALLLQSTLSGQDLPFPPKIGSPQFSAPPTTMAPDNDSTSLDTFYHPEMISSTTERETSDTTRNNLQISNEAIDTRYHRVLFLFLISMH
jgi:hypothetical protein